MAALKRDRIQQRFVGTFVYTDVLRGFDGFHFVYNKPKINYTWMTAVSTQGVFQKWMVRDGSTPRSVMLRRPGK